MLSGLTWLLSSHGVLWLTVCMVAVLVMWLRFVGSDCETAPPPGEAALGDPRSSNPSVRRRRKLVAEGRAADEGFVPPLAAESLGDDAVQDSSVMTTEVVVVPTTYGKVEVAIVGPKDGRITFLTFSDVASSYRVEWNGLFQVLSAHRPFHSVRRIHILPHTLPPPFPGITALPTLVDEVVQHLNLRLFVGMGIGAGAYVMLRYAIEFGARQRRLDALVLCSGTRKKCGMSEWINVGSIIANARMQGVNYSVVNSISKLNLSYPAHRSGPGLAYRDGLADLPPAALMGYMMSYMARPDITDEEMELLVELKLPVLCLAGRTPGGLWPIVPGYDHVKNALNVFHSVDKTNSTWMRIPDSSLVLSLENPRDCVRPLQLFMATCGYHHF